MEILRSNLPTNLELPQHAYDKVLLAAERWMRADAAHQEWARKAKEVVDFVEGKQWSEEDLKKAEEDQRPALTFNKMGRLIRLVLGYHRNNRTDLKVLPGFDGTGSQEVANVLTKAAKSVSEMTHLPYVDTEVFLDGITAGRGYYDYRLDFEKNDFGEIKPTAKDPFAIRLDPDGTTYDLNESCTFVMEARTVSIEEVEFFYGQSAAALLWPYVGRHGAYTGGYPAGIMEQNSELTPWRGFGGQEGGPLGSSYMAVDAYLTNAFDRARKTIRLIDMQHQVRMMMWHFVDLETGDREPIPPSWGLEDPDPNVQAKGQEQVQKALWWAEQHYARQGKMSPIRVARRPGKKIRWTTLAGDLVVYDEWSAYETYTLIPYFPWFRRGKTRGMGEDLIDPQKEINKRGSAEVDIITRTAHAGWLYHRAGLSEEMKQRLEQHGAETGLNLEWTGDAHQKPEKIQPGVPPTAMEKLDQKNTDRLMEISGINESALGDLDRVQSGVAVEARQRQAVLAIQCYMDNKTRTKELGGVKLIEMFQNHYTEERLIRNIDDDGQITFEKLNEILATGQIKNDITLGKYVVNIDETPLAASHMRAQTEELKEMIEAGIIPIPAVQDVAIKSSSIPQKEVVLRRVQALQAAAGIPMGDALLTPGGAAQATAAMATGAMPMPGGNTVEPAKPGQPAAGPNIAGNVVPMPGKKETA